MRTSPVPYFSKISDCAVPYLSLNFLPKHSLFLINITQKNSSTIWLQLHFVSFGDLQINICQEVKEIIELIKIDYEFLLSVAKSTLLSDP